MPGNAVSSVLFVCWTHPGPGLVLLLCWPQRPPVSNSRQRPGPSVPAATEDRPLSATRSVSHPFSYPAARPGMTQRDERKRALIDQTILPAEYLQLSEGGRHCRIKHRSARSGRPSALPATRGVVRHPPRLLPARSRGRGCPGRRSLHETNKMVRDAAFDATCDVPQAVPLLNTLAAQRHDQPSG